MAMNKTEAAAFKAMEKARDMARALRWPTYAKPTPVDASAMPKGIAIPSPHGPDHAPTMAFQGWSARTYRDQAGAFKIWSTGSATTTHIEADGRRIPWSQGRGAVIYLTEREALQAARLAKTIEYAADLARLDALIAALDDEQPRD